MGQNNFFCNYLALTIAFNIKAHFQLIVKFWTNRMIVKKVLGGKFCNKYLLEKFRGENPANPAFKGQTKISFPNAETAKIKGQFPAFQGVTNLCPMCIRYLYQKS